MCFSDLRRFRLYSVSQKKGTLYRNYPIVIGTPCIERLHMTSQPPYVGVPIQKNFN
jgi:hypothetical protein